MEIVWTKKAINKLSTFIDYIAQDDIITAEKWSLSVIEKTSQLKKYPELGRKVPEFNLSN